MHVHSGAASMHITSLASTHEMITIDTAGKPYSPTAHPCSYGFTYRKAHLGDDYVAQVCQGGLPWQRDARIGSACRLATGGRRQA